MAPPKKPTISMEGLLVRLSDAISELSVTVATQRERLDNVEEKANTHARDIRELRDGQQTTHLQIQEVKDDLSKKLNTQTVVLQGHVDASIQKIVAAVEASDKKREDGDKAIRTLVEEANKQREEGDKAIQERVQALEIWRYVIVAGASIVLVVFGGLVWKIGSILIDKMDWSAFLK